MASTLELVFQAATALGTLVTAGSIYILKRTLDAQRHTLESQDTSLQAQLKALDTEYAWRRMNVAIDLMREWNSNAIGFRNAIVKLGIELYGEPNDTSYLKEPISAEEARRLWDASATSEDSAEIKRVEMREKMIGLLNYFEYICAAYKAGAVDEKIIKVSFKAPMTRWYELLKAFIDNVDRRRNTRTWPPYCEVMELWIQQPKPEPPDTRFIDPAAQIPDGPRRLDPEFSTTPSKG